MPTDSVKNRTFKDILNGTVRFEIPFFQRGYAWQRKQWDQLFLRYPGGDYLGALNGVVYGSAGIFLRSYRGSGEDRRAPELKEFLVVDGQQRITTIYLLLGLIRELIAQKNTFLTTRLNILQN